MNVLDLFSGIGGFSLGLERIGMATVAFCEKEPQAQTVLQKHWPEIPVFDDIKKLNKKELDKYGIEKIDVITGGFPCQDISTAGKQAGIAGDRSGLWSECARLIGEIKPRYAIIENVANLRSKGLVTVLQDLWSLGYDAEWHIIPAHAVGAPHKRERIWIIAYRDGLRVEGTRTKLETAGIDKRIRSHWETAQPRAMRVDDGVSPKIHRNRIQQCGNAIVPQIAECIGKAILAT